MPRSDVTVEMRADSRRLRRDLYRARREWNAYARQVRSQVQGLARDATLVATAAAGAATGLVTASVREFEQVNKELIKTRTLVGITKREFQDLRDVVYDLGQTFGVSLKEISNASVGVFSAQLRGAQATRVLTTSVKLSALGFGDARESADLLTGSIRTYGAEVLSASRAGDILFAAAREGNFDPRELASGMSRVLPIANQLGIEFEEIAGAFASLSLVNIAPARAATAFIGIFSALIKPTQQAVDELDRFGLTIDDLRNAVRDKSLVDGLAALYDLFDGDLDSIGRVIPSLEGLPGFFSLVGERADETRVITDRLRDSFGDLDDAVAILEDSGATTFDKLGVAASVLGVKLGEAISEELYRRADEVTAALQEMARFIPQVARSIVAFSGNFANLIRVLYVNRDAIETLIKAYVGLRVAIVASTVAVGVTKGIVAFLDVLRNVTNVATASVGGLNAAFRALIKSGIITYVTMGLLIYIHGAYRRATGQTSEAVKALQEEVTGLQERASALLAEELDAGKPYRDAVKDVKALENEVQRLTNRRDNLADDSLFRTPAALANREALIEQNQAELAQAEENLRSARARRDLFAQDLEEIKQELVELGRQETQLRNQISEEQGGNLLNPVPNLIEGSKALAENLLSGVTTLFDIVTDGYDGIVDEATQAVEEAEAKAQAAIEGPAFEEAPAPTIDEPDLEPFRFEGGVLGSAIVSGIDDAIRNNSSQALGLSILEGINSTVQSAASNVLQAGINSVFRAAFGDTLQNTIEAGLTKIFSSAFDALGSLLGGLLGGAGAAAGAGVAAPTAHGGGYIPGFRGQEVPIIAQAGELVLTERQQQRLLGGNGTNVTINATGDVDAATQRALAVSGRQVAHLLQQQRREGVYVG